MSAEGHIQFLPPDLTLEQRVLLIHIAATTTDQDVKRHALGVLDGPSLIRFSRISS